MEKIELTRKEKINKIVELFSKFEQGVTISLEAINEFADEDLKDEYGKARFRNIMGIVKNILIEKGIIIRCIYNKGYYILKNNQVSGYTYRNYIIKPMKQFEKANKIMDKFNKKALNNKELNECYKVAGLTKAIGYATNELINCDEYKELQDTNVKEKKNENKQN